MTLPDLKIDGHVITLLSLRCSLEDTFRTKLAENPQATLAECGYQIEPATQFIVMAMPSEGFPFAIPKMHADGFEPSSPETVAAPENTITWLGAKIRK